MLLFNRYEYNPKTDLLGKGGFSRVYKAVDKKFNRLLALKIYKTSDLSDRYSPIAEIQRVIDLDHPNISRYMDIDEIEKEDAFGEIEKIQVCVMELLDGGNIAKFYQANKDLSILKKLLIDVLHGLSYLHRNGIIHRDIKPANILIKKTIDGPIAKITDFGISKKSDSNFNSTSSALIVSIPYMAPEQLNLQRYGINEKVSYNIDFWSLGVAVYETISGEVLFKNSEHDSSEQIMTNIMSPELPEKINLLPQPFKTFISACIIKDAKQRIQNAEELIDILNTDISEPVKSQGLQNQDDGVSGVTSLPIASHEDIEENTKSQSPAKEGSIVQNDLGDLTENFPPADHGADIEKQSEEIPTYKENDFSEAQGNLNNNDEVGPSDALHEKEDNEDQTRVISRRVEIETGEDPDDTRILISPYKKDLLLPVKEEESAADDETKLIPASFKKDKTSEDQKENNDDTKILSGQKENDTTDVTKIIIGSVKANKTSTIFQQKEGPVTLFNRYTYLPSKNLIGKGGFSRVYKAYDNKLGRFVALKIYKTGEFSDNYSPIAEIRRVVNLDHPNICRYLDIEEIEKENPFGENEKIQVCVMELLDSGNFAEYHKANPSLDILKKLLDDILNGLAYLHKKGIVHRDIKPANILIKEGVEGPIAKITDFGISKITDSVNNNSSSALVVSIPYMAPEQLNPRKYGIDEKITYNLDLWSLGVTIYEVITGNALFKDNEQESSEQIMANIMSPGLPEKINDLPEPFRNIVSHCVVKNARERSRKAEDLLELLHGHYDTAAVIEKPAETIVPAAPVPPLMQHESPRPENFQKPDISAEPATEIMQEQIKPEKKRFSTIDFSSNQSETKAKKSISYLKISIAAAAAILLVILVFYFMTSSTDNASLNGLKINDTTEKKAKPTVIENPKSPDATTKNLVVIPPPNADSAIKKNSESHGDIKKKKNPAVKNLTPETKDRTAKKEASNKVINGTCHVEFTATETCMLTINSLDYGKLEAGKPLTLDLHLGTIVLEAVRVKDNYTISEILHIKPELLNKGFSHVIRFSR